MNVASLAGRFAPPGSAVYTATKHAVVAFSESLDYDADRTGVHVTAVNPGLVATEGFPQTGVPKRFVMAPERVAEAIVKVVREGIAPEYSVPRWLAPFQVFRVLTPPLYRWGVRQVRTRRAGDEDALMASAPTIVREPDVDELDRARRALDRHRLERPDQPDVLRHLGLPEAVRVPARTRPSG